MHSGRVYLAIDLKSFYASVECMDRKLDPLDTNLVVADESRTDKTICLAVSPSLKALGLPGRCRLFEVRRAVDKYNRLRKPDAPVSYSGSELAKDPSKRLGFIAAKPQMARYIEISTKIYQIYLRHIAPEDIHIYSIDEVFIDATSYLKAAGLTPRGLAARLMGDVLKETGVTATCGIGTNPYLAKVAMDIVAKHIPADENGSRIAELDEMSYRRKLWDHRPLTDFWRVGKGLSRKLEAHGLFTMGDVALCSEYSEDTLYKLFGVNAELLIDHAWGWEPCTIADIKAYKPSDNSISNGQVLACAVDSVLAKTIVREMSDSLALQLSAKHLTTDRVELNLIYEPSDSYDGPEVNDFYGRLMPKPSHGAVNLSAQTASSRLIGAKINELYDRICDTSLMIRRIYVIFARLADENAPTAQQLDMFTDYAADEKESKRDSDIQNAILGIRKKYGANALIKGMDLTEGATARDRNAQIGGHKA